MSDILYPGHSFVDEILIMLGLLGRLEDVESVEDKARGYQLATNTSPPLGGRVKLHTQTTGGSEPDALVMPPLDMLSQA